MTLIWSIFLYLCVQLAINIWVARKVKSQDDFFLAGRSLGTGLVTFSIFATWFGAETCIGAAATVFEGGLFSSRAEPFGYTACLIVMSLFLATRLWKEKVVTLADLYRREFSPGVEALGALILLSATLIWAAAQIRAFGQIMSAVSPMDPAVSITVAAIFVILYTFMGGLIGDVYTDVIQGSVLIIGLSVLLLMVVNELGGVTLAIESIAVERLSFVAAGESWLSRIDTWMIPVLGSLVTQEMVSRVLGSKSSSVARVGTFCAALIYLVVGLIPITLGLLGPGLLGNLSEKDQFLPLLAKDILPPLAFIVFSGALISAILSTVDSTLLSASAFLSNNVMGSRYRKLSPRRQLYVARFFIVASGLTAYVMALGASGIYDLVIFASYFGTPGILVITLFSIFQKGFATPLSGYATLLVGLGAGPLLDYGFSFEAPFMGSVVLCGLCMVLVTLVQKKFYWTAEVTEN